MRKQKFFFTSAEHAPCVLNKWGVVLVPDGHELGVDYWHGFEYVPVASHELKHAVLNEAQKAGARWDFRGRGDPRLVWNRNELAVI
jgi:hypothetical protein